MKLKNIISAVIVAGAVLTASSCEDMFKVDSKVVLYDYENTLDRATDTVYSVLGIIKNMQKIADRSVILGEVRGDLVSTSDHANKDLAELYNYDFKNLRKTNRYNKPSDYYAVINNCNFFLAHDIIHAEMVLLKKQASQQKQAIMDMDPDKLPVC